MTDLDTRVRQAFDNVTVPDDVKRGTLTYIASIAEASGVSAETAPASAAAPRKRARARIIPLRRAAAALAACLALAFAGFGGFAYAQPTTYVGIDINPSIELGVNRFGIVVRAEALNGDGDVYKRQLELRQQRGFVACVHHRFAGCVGEVGVLDAGEVLRPAFHDAEGALNSCVADEAKGCHRDEEAPFHRMGAHFALFSPYFHRSTILP